MSEPSSQADTLSLTLRQPIKVGDQVYETLELREPTAGEFEQMAKLADTNPTGSLILLISAVSGVPQPVVKKIGMRDINAAGEFLLGFIRAGQPTQTS